MARPLRINLAGGWYHVVSRGNGGERIFRDDTDRRRFLGLVSELPERFSVEIHAFVRWGRRIAAYGYGFAGQIDNLAVYTRPVPAAEFSLAPPLASCISSPNSTAPSPTPAPRGRRRGLQALLGRF